MTLAEELTFKLPDLMIGTLGLNDQLSLYDAFNVFGPRDELQHHGLPASPDAENVILHRDLLPPLGTLCGRLVDQVRLLILRESKK